MLPKFNDPKVHHNTYSHQAMSISDKQCFSFCSDRQTHRHTHKHLHKQYLLCTVSIASAQVTNVMV